MVVEPTETITLDTALKGESRIDLIKIDIEGAEDLAWDGMQEIIDKNDDITIIMEYNPSFYDNSEALIDKVLMNGFLLGVIDEENSNIQYYRSKKEFMKKYSDKFANLFLEK